MTAEQTTTCYLHDRRSPARADEALQMLFNSMEVTDRSLIMFSE